MAYLQLGLDGQLVGRLLRLCRLGFLRLGSLGRIGAGVDSQQRSV